MFMFLYVFGFRDFTQWFFCLVIVYLLLIVTAIKCLLRLFLPIAVPPKLILSCPYLIHRYTGYPSYPILELVSLSSAIFPARLAEMVFRFRLSITRNYRVGSCPSSDILFLLCCSSSFSYLSFSFSVRYIFVSLYIAKVCLISCSYK